MSRVPIASLKGGRHLCDPASRGLSLPWCASGSGPGPGGGSGDVWFAFLLVWILSFALRVLFWIGGGVRGSGELVMHVWMVVLVVVEGSLVSAHLDWMGGGGSGGACLEELNTDCLGTHKPFCLPSWSRRTRFFKW